MDSLNKLGKWILNVYEAKGWTGQKLVIWFTIGWVFQLMAGFGLIVYLIAHALVHYEKRSYDASENDDKSNQFNVRGSRSNNRRPIESRDGSKGKNRNRERVWEHI